MQITPIKCRSDFLRVAAKRRKWASPGLVLQVDQTPYIDPEDKPLMRVGYTASRRVGGAVERNRAKRRLRAAVSRVMPLLALPEYDYVLIARKTTLTRNFEDLISDLSQALSKTRTIRTNERSN